MFIWITACTAFTYTIYARRPCAAIPSIRKARREWMKMNLLSLCGVVSRKFMHILGRTYQGKGKSMRKGHKEGEVKSVFDSFQIHEKKRNDVSLLMLRFYFFTLITTRKQPYSTRTQKEVGRRQGRSGETEIVKKVQALLGIIVRRPRHCTACVARRKGHVHCTSKIEGNNKFTILL